MGEDRSWMYNRIENGLLRSEFRDGVLRFVDFALHQPGCTDGAKIKCPCNQPKCRNKRYLEVNEVMIHLCRKGFLPFYEVWSSHGERFVHKDTHVGESSNRVDYRGDDYIQMVMDAAGPEMFDVETGVDVGDEEPNPDAKKFYELLDAASKPLYPGSEKHTQLSFISRILNVKCESKMSNSAFSDILQLIKERYFAWDEADDAAYYKAWKHHAGRMYSVLMNRFTELHRKKGMKHPALSDEQYRQWCAHWSDADFQKLSSTMSDNRHSEVCGQGTGISRHLGGSIPVLKHVDNMRKEASGEPPKAWNVFQKIKCRNGVPVDEQSKQIKDRMEARIKELTDAGATYDINEVFSEVNAISKKQRVVGLGSASSSFCIAGSSPTGESSGQSSRQVTEEIQQLKENLNAKDEEIRRLKEEQDSMKEVFNEKLAEVFRRLDSRTDNC